MSKKRFNVTITKHTQKGIRRGAVVPRQVIPHGCNLDTGDIMFTSGPDWMSRWVKFWTRHRGESPSISDHQQLIFEPGTVQSFTLFKGPRDFTFYDYWADMRKRGDEWIIYRHSPAPDDLMKSGLRGEMKYAARQWKYSHAELALQALDNLIEKIVGKRVILFRKLGRLWEKGVVCSTGSNIVLKSTGWLPAFARYFSPDDTLDYIIAHPDDWTEVVRSIGWGEL